MEKLSLESPRGSWIERFREAKRAEIEDLCLRRERGELAVGAPAAPGRGAFAFTRPSFAEALRRVPGRSAIVAEYKRASPSRGNINLTLTPEDAARCYAEAGAAAMSVLTEQHCFGGDLSFLARAAGEFSKVSKVSEAGKIGKINKKLPLLRKDFIFHPLQVAATAETPASALLVIVRMLNDEELTEILDACEACGLEPVCEIFSENDLERLRARGRKIPVVQVNNRDLDTLETDFSLSLSRGLIPRKREGELWISASGCRERRQIEEMEALGFDAFLAGTFLMESGDPAAALSLLAGTPDKRRSGVSQ
jgi:indole-3-glycerol phosphate synthase